MKFRSYLLIFAVILLAVALTSVGMFVRSQPRTFNFLGNAQAKKVDVVSEPIGPGRDVRYYVLNQPFTAVNQAARQELLQKGWRAETAPVGLYHRGHHGVLLVSAISASTDPKLDGGIPVSQWPNYTVVKVVDPRFETALKDRIANWAGGGPNGAR